MAGQKDTSIILPPELLEKVFEYVEPKERHIVAKACHTFERIIFAKWPLVITRSTVIELSAHVGKKVSIFIVGGGATGHKGGSWKEGVFTVPMDGKICITIGLGGDRSRIRGSLIGPLDGEYTEVKVGYASLRAEGGEERSDVCSCCCGPSADAQFAMSKMILPCIPDLHLKPGNFNSFGGGGGVCVTGATRNPTITKVMEVYGAGGVQGAGSDGVAIVHLAKN